MLQPILHSAAKPVFNDCLTSKNPSRQPTLIIPGSQCSAIKSGTIATGVTPALSAIRLHSCISWRLTARICSWSSLRPTITKCISSTGCKILSSNSHGMSSAHLRWGADGISTECRPTLSLGTHKLMAEALVPATDCSGSSTRSTR